VGCLIARREALARLWRPWFSGGTIYAVSVQGDWHALAGDESRFEDGTLNFLHSPDVEFGLSWVSAIGIDVIDQRVTCLTGWLLDRLAAMRHGNGQPMTRIYGPADLIARGGTVSFNLLDPAGNIVDERAVARDTAAAGISIRTGCFCNPGAAEGMFELTRPGITRAMRGGLRTVDEYIEALGLPTAGGIRASLGLASNIEDAERFLGFLEATYRDRLTDVNGLAPRLRC
jgi:selenocysteine lyase/cysteine desulfurase